jgi:tetratricopeptide (TPR) repeat protein
MKSPSRQIFETTVQHARTAKTKALAHYRLAAFHDRNGREAEAIPHYHAALDLGLPPKTKAQALAWLASSYYKVGDFKAAIRQVLDANKIARSPALRRFLERLRQKLIATGKLSCHDLAQDLCGSIHGTGDLSTNPTYMEGFGEYSGYAQREYGVTEEQLDRFADASEAMIERLRASGELEKYRFTPKQLREKIAQCSAPRPRKLA